MIQITEKEFLADAEALLIGAVADDNFLKIKTSIGNAVLISEAEWNVLTEAMKSLLAITK